MSALEASDGARCNDMELEKNTQEPQDSARNHQTWLNARTDPFILKFPPEISAYIFFLSMTMDTPGELHKLPMEFLLGSVCRGWRLLARSTPELWSKVSFRLAKPPRKPEGLSQLEAVSGWLQLSGDVPLTLHIFKYWVPIPSRKKDVIPLSTSSISIQDVGKIYCLMYLHPFFAVSVVPLPPVVSATSMSPGVTPILHQLLKCARGLAQPTSLSPTSLHRLSTSNGTISQFSQ